MAEYVAIDKAVEMPGLRVVLMPGIPGPWGEAVKGFLHVKKIPYTKVIHDRRDSSALVRWTAQSSFPVMIYNDERPRSVWSEQLCLAERIQPTPRLIPANLDERVTMFGLSNELCGENGLGWARRLLLIHGVAANPNADERARKGMLAFGGKYGYSQTSAEAAPARIAQIVAAFDARLESQHARGSRFLIGDQLSALDIYWAAFAALLQPLPLELCPMPPDLRRGYHYDDAGVQVAAAPLLAHRDFIYREFLQLPVDL